MLPWKLNKRTLVWLTIVTFWENSGSRSSCIFAVEIFIILNTRSRLVTFNIRPNWLLVFRIRTRWRKLEFHEQKSAFYRWRLSKNHYFVSLFISFYKWQIRAGYNAIYCQPRADARNTWAVWGRLHSAFYPLPILWRSQTSPRLHNTILLLLEQNKKHKTTQREIFKWHMDRITGQSVKMSDLTCRIYFNQESETYNYFLAPDNLREKGTATSIVSSGECCTFFLLIHLITVLCHTRDYSLE